jgi:hypothetical protein
VAWLSILGLYNLDQTIFDGLQLPTSADLSEAIPHVEDPFEPDKDVLISYICMNLAELSLVYASPDTMKQMIKTWSDVHQVDWAGLYETLVYKYNPIWNKDGTRSHTVQGKLHVMTGGNTTGVDTDQTNTSTYEVTGYDSNTYSPANKETTTAQGEAAKNKTTLTYNAQTDSADYTETETESGNIGVTTTQSMIEEQRKVVQFNFYDFICRQFKEQFCVMVY